MLLASSKVILAGLSNPLGEELARTLRALSVEIVGVDEPSASVAFCAPDRVAELHNHRPDVAVVVVSSRREVGEWVTAMEAGAQEYCAAPFEALHLDWVIRSSLRSATTDRAA